ncbi:MAG: tetratricopeptide repeat protein [Erythrobacter sp.]|nr:tetratricopeptide repeat protein [Erythrobacter sp.]
MKSLAARPSTRLLAVALGVATLATSPLPASAQDETSEARLRKIEAEIRALQRNVFPGGDGRFFEPQITAGDTNSGSTTAGSAASTTAVTDILARLDAIELQMQRLTAITEENANSLSLVQTRLAALESDDRAALASEDSEATDEAATDSNLAVMTGGASSDGSSRQIESGNSTESAAGPSAERLAAVQAITKPQTDDEADDEYSYGFRLWNAGFYPEARQQLSDFIEKYPSHWRATYGRNLLGRAFLDDGMAEDAARWFLRNYQADRTAPRAPDSLLYLAEAMIALDDTRRACIALAEFGETYPAIASGRLLGKYEENRGKVTCE